MQKMWGKQQDFLENCDLFFGKDRWYWFSPTHPALKINYLEKMYPRTQLRQIIRAGGKFEEDEWDLNKKYYLRELRHSNFEKRICLGLLMLLILLWFFYWQPLLLAPYAPNVPEQTVQQKAS